MAVTPALVNVPRDRARATAAERSGCRAVILHSVGSLSTSSSAGGVCVKGTCSTLAWPVAEWPRTQTSQ